MENSEATGLERDHLEGSSVQRKNQIVDIFKEHEVDVATKEICRRPGVSPATFYIGKTKFVVEIARKIHRTSPLAQKGAQRGRELLDALLT